MWLQQISARAVPVLLVGAFILAPAAQAIAGSSSFLYVNGAAVNCSDTGPGSQTQPFCSIQAAADVANPGQTVEISGASAPAYGAVTITRSGTATQPITFTSATPGAIMPQIYAPTAQPSVTISGAHDIVLSYLNVYGNVGGIEVAGGQDITLDRLFVYDDHPTASNPSAVAIGGASSRVTLSRSEIISTHGAAVHVTAGAQQVTVTSNYLYGAGPAGGIAVDGVVGADLTSNSAVATCGSAIAVAASTGVVAENNVLGVQAAAGCSGPGAALLVAADSTAAVQADYNALFAALPGTEYSWAGTGYPTAAKFSVATGQGSHDQDAARAPTRFPPAEGSPLIDSADCAAPGELTTDLYGHPHVRDPLDTPTGAGSCFADRGAAELQDPLAPAFSTSGLLGAAPLSVSLTMTSGATSPWKEAVSYSVDFGDGSALVAVAAGASVTHSYVTPGRYTLTVSATDSGGSSASVIRRVLVGTTSPPAEGLTAQPWILTAPTYAEIASDAAVFTISPGSDSWEIASVSLAFGDGVSLGFPSGPQSWTHLYPRPGTYTATLTVTDLLGRVRTSQAAITVGDEFIQTQPDQDIGPAANGQFTIPAHKLIRVSMGQLNAGFPSVAAVQLVAAVTGAPAAGSVTIYPDGSARPAIASLGFGAGQAVSNEVLAAPGASGMVDIYNSSSKTVAVTLHTIGLEVTSDGTSGEDGDTFAPVGPVRVLDTRSPVNGVHRQLGAGRQLTFSVASAGVPSSADEVVLDVTATATHAAGSALLYSKSLALNGLGVASPYWGAGQTVTSLVAVPVTGPDITVRNASKGSADFLADVVGYYNHFGEAGVFLPARGQLNGARPVTIAAGTTLRLPVPGCLGAAVSGISAVAVNLAAAGAAQSGYLSAYRSATSGTRNRTLSYRPGQATAGAAILKVGTGGALWLHNNGARSVQVSVELNGCYFQYQPRP